MLPRSLPRAFLLISILASSTQAVTIPLDPSQFTDPSLLLPAGVAGELVKGIGLIADQRPYEPASGLGTSIGLDFGAELTLVKLPDSLVTKLEEIGLVSGGSIPPAIPLPRIQVHKGFGKRFDLGGSWVGYEDFRVYGIDAKIVLYQPTEGPVWAFRGAFSDARIGFVFTRTWTWQVLVSQPLEFAEPYLGVGYQKIYGKIAVSVPLPAPLEDQSVTIDSPGKASSFMAFTGVGFTLGPTAIRITLEGGYSGAGGHTLGTKVGFRL